MVRIVLRWISRLSLLPIASRLHPPAMNPVRLTIALVLVAVSFGRPSPARADGLTAQEEFFENEVRPLLVAKCQECHDASLQESDLRLDGLAFVLQGGISGPAAVARNVADSPIIKAVLGQDDFERMPPDEPLQPDEIDVLKKWVRIGLPWTSSDQPALPSLGDQEAIGQAAETHWAFQQIAPVQVPVPQGSSSKWVANPVDAFVAQKLDENGLSPSAQASRRVLARRMFFDLIGLPPTAEQLDALEHDSRPTSEVVAELADRLLASDHHGERWARHWMDLARYADTRDWQAQAELRYPYAYTYRDYLIDSLNQDKPYDQFIREQIAADFYVKADDSGAAPSQWAPSQWAALGFLTVGPRFRNNRLEQNADTIDVVCRGLMGITVSCARCHDHKYDPIPIEDFYSLYGVFASSEIPEALPVIEGPEVASDEREDFTRKIAARERELHDYKQDLRQEAIADLKKRLPKYFDGFVLMSVNRKSDIRGTISKLKVKETAMTPFDRKLNDATKNPRLRNDPVLGPWQQGLSLSEAQFKKQRTGLLERWQADEKLNRFVRERIVSGQPATRTELVLLYASIFDDVVKDWNRLEEKQPDAPELPDADRQAVGELLFSAGGLFDLDADQVAAASRLFGKGRKALGDLQKAITEVEATHPGAPARAMMLVDVKKPITPFVFLRGESNRKGPRVPRQFLGLIEGDDRTPFRDGSGRRELAEAIVDPTNPLTARVFVNRVWSRYFGTGLATSLDDFGLRSDPPSHPELLDYLAGEFIRSGWSMKGLHRTIVTSNTYAQAADIRDHAFDVDPANRLLWRQNRRRLDFEAMRDSMLAAAGALDTTVGGRSVVLSEVPYTTRRSVYAYIDRIELDPMLRTFDFASPTASAAQRAQTTIPQQALFGMNHPLVAQLARQISSQVSSLDGIEGQVDAVYRKVHGRTPEAPEFKAATEFVQASIDSPPVSRDSIWQYGYGPAGREGQDGFVALSHWTGNSYQASDQLPDPEMRFVRATSAGGHPGENDQVSLVRRWVAPDSGRVRIRGTLKHSREGSDGVVASIRHRGTILATVPLAMGQAKTTVPVIDVKAGEIIDLIVAPGPTSRADSFSWIATIQGAGGQLDGRSWDSRADFRGPPPPMLDPIAQLAQALMLTNEFLYLD